MTERLDRIEAILSDTATQQRQTSADIETLLGACSTNLTACQELRAAGAAADARLDQLTERAESNERRFELLLSEAQADRLETARRWNDAVEQMNTDRAAARAAAEADRAAAKAQADTDRAETRRHFDAQQEVIQRLLVELVEMNRDNRRLRDRLDNLEQAS